MMVINSVLTVPGTARGEDSIQPVAVLSLAASDELINDFRYIARIVGRPDAGAHLQRVGAPFLENLVPERPAGVFITIEASEPRGVGFLPVPDSKKLLAALQSKLDAQVTKLDNGVIKLEWGKGTYLKQQGEWLYFTDHLHQLSQLPENPVALLDGLQHEYDIAFRLFVRNIPQGLKDVIDFSAQTKIDAVLQASATANSEIDAAFLKSCRRDMKQTVSTLISASDQITLGLVVDRQTRRARIELQAQAQQGSSLSRQISMVMDNRSTFTGFFMDEAAVSFQGSMRIPQSGQTRISSFLNDLRHKALRGIDADPNAPESVKDIVTKVIDVVDQTVREGKTDTGATLVLGPATFNFVGGVRVADGQTLANAFQQLFALAQHEPDVPRVNFYASTYKHLDLHTLSLPIAKDDEDARKLLGSHVDITMATGPEQLYFALGRENDEVLKQVIDQCRKLAPKECLCWIFVLLSHL